MGDIIQRPKSCEKKVECFTAAEQKMLEEAIMASKKQKLLGIVICLYTGLRIGELLALTWNDVDFEKGEINVTKSCYCGKRGRVVDGVKTEHSKRVIPLSKQVLKVLRMMKKTSDSEYVISSKGKPVTTRSYQRSFEIIQEKLHISNDIKKEEYEETQHMIKTYTKENEVVMDNCMGSGSSGVACRKTGRQFIGIEADGYYFQSAKARIEKGYGG